MKISTRTEYGIRVLVTLAGVGPDDGCLSLTQIAKREKLTARTAVGRRVRSKYPGFL